MEVLARRSAPPWRWKTSWLVDVGVDLTLLVAGMSLRFLDPIGSSQLSLLQT